ncbi:MAG: glycosyltransferase family 4 protein [Actinomycetes bacterium]
MRILVVNWRDLAHPRAGGAEVYTHEITAAWARTGHQVTWFSAAVTGHPEREVIDGVSHVRRGGRFTVYRQARRFYESEGRGRFDLVIDEVNTRPFLTPRYVDDAHVVALIHQVCREIWFYEMPWPVAVVGRFWLERRWLGRYRDVPVLTVSDSSRQSLQAYGLRRVSLVSEGIATTVRPRGVLREQAPTVLFVGRLSANKRPADALEAFARLRESMPDAQMWVVGTGPLHARLAARAPVGVTFFGRVSEERKRELMARAHVLVVTSVREGWGLVVDEAAATGTPTIAYDVAGLRDSVAAAGGVLVAPHPISLAGALAQWLPTRVTRASPTGWAGGARPWGAVAEEFLAQAWPHEPAAIRECAP